MLLSNKYNFLFVHIAKTGGTSIRAALNPLRWRDPLYGAQFICSKLSKITQHKIGSKFPRHSKVIAAIEMLPTEHFEQLYKFAFVRNPWDLQISSYHHLKRERPKLLENIPDFESFLKWKLNLNRPYQYHIDTSIQIQTEFLVNLQGDIVMNKIGRYENLHEDFNEICQFLNLKNIRLPHKRKATDRKPYRQYYNDSSAELVAHFFKRDIENFQYSFD